MSDSSTDQDSSRNQDSSADKNTLDLDTLFKRADDIVATSVIGRPKRGSGYIPKIDAKIRLNVEVMDWLKTMGPRHYSRINGLLTALMEADKLRGPDSPAASESPDSPASSDSPASPDSSDSSDPRES